MALGVVPAVSADRTEREQLPRGQLVDRCCQPDRERPRRSAVAVTGTNSSRAPAHRRSVAGALVLRFDRAYRLDMRADPVFGIGEVNAPAHREPGGTETSARFVVVPRRRAGLVESVGLRDVRWHRRHFIVGVRLDLLRLLERARLGDGPGALGTAPA